jgi:hypothetical protein
VGVGEGVMEPLTVFLVSVFLVILVFSGVKIDD